MKNNKNNEETLQYLNNPNLSFKKVMSINDMPFQGFSINRFDFFILDKIIYIVVPSVFYLGSNPLCIYKLNKFLNLEKTLSLDGHKNPIILVKNFFDEKHNKNYLITSDIFPLVLIWEIENENSIILKYTISIYNFGEILSALILFEPKNKIIVTSNNESLYSSEFSLNSGNFIRYIPGTNNKTYYILEYKDYIIELCFDKIYFYDLKENEEKFLIKNENTKGINIYGYIMKDTLFINNFSQGKIMIFDLLEKIVIKVIDTYNNENLNALIEWNTNYIIANDIKNQYFYIIDVIQKKIINKVKTKLNPKYIKKIKLDKEKYYSENILLILDDKFKFEIFKKK